MVITVVSLSENIRPVNREELKGYLPHREPMLLVDEIEIDDDGICRAWYKVKEDEFFLPGAFPWQSCCARSYPM